MARADLVRLNSGDFARDDNEQPRFRIKCPEGFASRVDQRPSSERRSLLLVSGGANDRTHVGTVFSFLLISSSRAQESE